jgi:hypothetical protein
MDDPEPCVLMAVSFDLWRRACSTRAKSSWSRVSDDDGGASDRWQLLGSSNRKGRSNISLFLSIRELDGVSNAQWHGSFFLVSGGGQKSEGQVEPPHQQNGTPTSTKRLIDSSVVRHSSRSATR